MRFDFATVQLGGFNAPGLPLAKWIEFFQLRILGQIELKLDAGLRRHDGISISAGCALWAYRRGADQQDWFPP